MDNFEAAFQRHLAESRASRSLRLKQAFFNVRRFYFLPLALGMLAGNLIADGLADSKADPVTWLTIFLVCIPVIAAAAYRFVVKDRGFDSERHFLMEALKLTLAERESRKE